MAGQFHCGDRCVPALRAERVRHRLHLRRTAKGSVDDDDTRDKRLAGGHVLRYASYAASGSVGQSQPSFFPRHGSPGDSSNVHLITVHYAFCDGPPAPVNLV